MEPTRRLLICPCSCNKYRTDCKEFHKIVESQDGGLVIYRYVPEAKDTLQKRLSETGESFILRNNKNAITHEDLTTVFEYNKMTCPRCIKIVKHAASLVTNVQLVDGQEVLGVCDHCRVKQRRHASSCKCKEVVKKFKTKAKEQREVQRQRAQRWLTQVQHLLKNALKDDSKGRKSKKRARSELSFDKLFSDLKKSEPKYYKEGTRAGDKLEMSAQLPNTARTSSSSEKNIDAIDAKEYLKRVLTPGKPRGDTSTSKPTFINLREDKETGDTAKAGFFKLTRDKQIDDVSKPDLFKLLEDKDTEDTAMPAFLKSEDIQVTVDKLHKKKTDPKKITSFLDTSEEYIESKTRRKKFSILKTREDGQFKKQEADAMSSKRSLKDNILKATAKQDISRVKKDTSRLKTSLEYGLMTDVEKQRPLSPEMPWLKSSSEQDLSRDFSFLFPKEKIEIIIKKRISSASSAELIKDLQDTLKRKAEEEKRKKEDDLKRNREEKEKKKLEKMEKIKMETERKELLAATEKQQLHEEKRRLTEKTSREKAAEVMSSITTEKAENEAQKSLKDQQNTEKRDEDELKKGKEDNLLKRELDGQESSKNDKEEKLKKDKDFSKQDNKGDDKEVIQAEKSKLAAQKLAEKEALKSSKEQQKKEKEEHSRRSKNENLKEQDKLKPENAEKPTQKMQEKEKREKNKALQKDSEDADKSATKDSDKKYDMNDGPTGKDEAAKEEQTIKKEETSKKDGTTIKGETTKKEKTVQKEETTKKDETTKKEKTIKKEETIKTEELTKKDDTSKKEKTIIKDETNKKNETNKKDETTKKVESTRNEEKSAKEETTKDSNNDKKGEEDKQTQRAANDELKALLALQEKEKAEREKLKKQQEIEKELAEKKAKEAEKLAKEAKSTKKFEKNKNVKETSEKPEEPPRKKSESPPPPKDLSFKDIKLRQPSPDDLILRLVKLKQTEPSVKGSLRLSKMNLPRIVIKNHTRHKCKDFNCPICKNSDLALDYDECLIAETDLNKPEEITDIIIGDKIYKNTTPYKKPQEIEKEPTVELIEEIEVKVRNEDTVMQESRKETVQTKPLRGKNDLFDPDATKGVIRYALSDRTFIDKGWTMLPTEKVVRKMNVYRMRPAHPEFDWFEHNKNKRVMQYDTGEKLAEFDDNGRGRWFYRSGKLALDYYDAEEINAQQRFVVYSSGELDERGRTRPRTILATFDYLGNGIVFDHAGKIRLKYNQTEGVVLDRSIGPVSQWKWHTLNDPPVLQQVMIDTQMPYKDPTIMKLGGPGSAKKRVDNEEMLAIEFDNFIKEKSRKLTQKFKPFQIRMKALKINEYFSLRVLDQATVYLLYRDGTTNLKINMGMILDHKEIVDTDTADVGDVSNSMERLPARTDSLAVLQQAVAQAQREERSRVRHERRLHKPAEPCASADRLTAAASRPLRPPLTTASSGTTVGSKCPCKSRKPPSNLYYDTRL